MKKLLFTLSFALLQIFGCFSQYNEHLINRPISLPQYTLMNDIDNDGDNDIVSVSRSGEVVWYEHESSDTSFTVNYIDIGGDLLENDVLTLNDLDSDGNTDILTLREFPTSELQWYQNDGTQNFSKIVIPSSIDNAIKIEVDDIEGDGDQDIISHSGPNVVILYNDGNQNFTEITIPVSGVLGFVLKDFDDDGNTDIVISKGSGGLSIIYQDASGNFSEDQVITSGVHRNIDTGDIDGDGDMDIVTELQDGSNYVVGFYYNQSNNTTFVSAQANFQTNGYIKLKDMDGDNDLDFTFSNSSPFGDCAAILRNDSTLNFNSNKVKIVNSDLHGDIRHLSVGDLNNDGNIDVITTIENAGRINLHLHKGNIYTLNNFHLTEVSKSSGDVQDISKADFDNDGDIDIVAGSSADRAFELWKNSGNNYDFEEKDIDNLPSATNHEPVDLDQDGDIDLVACNRMPQGWYLWYENDGTGEFTKHLILQISNGGAMPNDVKVSDIDNDGDIDILAIGYPEIHILYNDGNENFTNYTVPGASDNYATGALNDIDTDGLTDIILWDNGQMAYCKNIGTGFNSPLPLNLNSTVGIFNQPSSIEFGDIDNDGDDDIVFSTGTIATAGVMKNLGGQSFDRYILYESSSMYGDDIKVADLDNDGFLELIVAHQGGVSIIENDAGSFTNFNRLTSNWYRFKNGSSVEVFDFNSDGNLDVAYSTVSGNRVAWFKYCNSTFSNIIQETTCASYTVPSGDETYTSSGTVMDTIINSNGCDSILTINLVINNSTTSTDVQTACNSYTWIDGNSYTSNNNTATHTLTNVAGCDSVVTLDLTINSVDNGVTVTNDTELNADQTGADYQWLDCDDNYAPISGETNQQFIVSSTGNYAVEVTINNCSDTSDCIEINDLKIGDQSPLSEITVYPNPTDGEVNIDLGALQNVTVELSTIEGKILSRKETTQSKHMIDIKAPKGLFIIKISYEATSRYFKVVKM